MNPDSAAQLLASVLRGESADWPSDGDVDTVVSAAEWHGVTPLVARSLATGASGDGWPESARRALAEGGHGAAAAELLRVEELRRLLAALDTAGVELLLFKGTHLAYAIYPMPWLRPRIDADLLIRGGDRRRVDEAIRGLGYSPVTDFGGELVTHQFHYEHRDAHGLIHTVDVHHKVSNPHAFADLLAFEELVGEAAPIPSLGSGARGPSPVHALVLACVHRTAHHDNSDRLIWLYDVDLLVRGMTPDELGRVGQLAVERGLRAVCAQTLQRTRSTLGTPVSESLADQLRADRSDAIEPTAAFLSPSRSKLDVLRSDLRALPDWRARVGLIREHLFPPVAYMQRAYTLSSPLVLPFLYVHRLAFGVGRWLRRP